MIDDKSKRILDKAYAQNLLEVLAYILSNDEQTEALELSKNLEGAVFKNITALKKQPSLLKFYQEAIAKLRFICLPALDDAEVLSLLKNNFCWQFKINDYDFFRKFRARLVNIVVISDRNKFKDEVKKVILENEERITEHHEIKTIKDWLKNYIVNIGLENVDNLAKVQYLMNLKNDKNISSDESEHLFVLFKFYDLLCLSSESPEGFDEEPPVVIDGKLCIFRQGVLEPVETKDFSKKLEIFSQTNNHLGEDNNQIINNKSDNVTQTVSEPVLPVVSELSELENMLASYPETSLEYKAIKQEINRIKVGEFKQAQKK